MLDLIITGIETITAFDILTGNFRFCLDELQSANISQSQENTDITGLRGRKLSTLKRNKAVTVSGTNGLVSGGMLEVQTGSKFEHKKTIVRWSETVAVASDVATIGFAAVGSTGNEIDSVYVRNTDGTLGAVYTQDATAGSGTFAYDPTTKKLTFASGALADGIEIVVYYDRQIMADVQDNMSENFSEKVTLYIDGFAEDKCANVYRIQFQIPKADFNGDFSIDFGENQTVHAFEAQSLAGKGCGSTLSTSGKLWTYIVFGADAEDAA